MGDTQRELMGALLDCIRSRGLISESVYSAAADVVYSGADFPEFFRQPVCLTEEEGAYGRAQDTQ